MSTHEQQEVAPLCGNCGRSMSPRDNNQWFCAGCAEYGRYLGIILPNAPGHPQFYRDLDGDVEQQRELLVGEVVERSPYGTQETEHVGRIVRIEETGDGPETLTVFIEKEQEFPFDRVVSEIEFERFRELIQEVTSPCYNNPIQKKAEVLVIV